ncbi:hypothetical protein BH23ACT11_BH23ACT11_09630 [soil metagenome]
MADDLQLARAAQKAALATRGVHKLGTGRFVEAATYGPGEKISGVVVAPERVEVHIVATYPLEKPVPDLAQDVRERVSPEVEGRETDVVVEDVEAVEQ